MSDVIESVATAIAEQLRANGLHINIAPDDLGSGLTLNCDKGTGEWSFCLFRIYMDGEYAHKRSIVDDGRIVESVSLTDPCLLTIIDKWGESAIASVSDFDVWPMRAAIERLLHNAISS